MEEQVVLVSKLYGGRFKMTPLLDCSVHRAVILNPDPDPQWFDSPGWSNPGSGSDIETNADPKTLTKSKPVLVAHTTVTLPR
jgi:hypothetical protein